MITKDRRLVLVACSSLKNPLLKSGPMPARFAYAGSMFRLARAYLEARGIKWVILSAKYGILWPGDKVEWYNEKMPSRTTEEEWVGSMDHMPQKQYGRLMSFDRYVCLGGADYCHAARMILGKPIESPLAGMGIGQRMQTLKLGTWE